MFPRNGDVWIWIVDLFLIPSMDAKADRKYAAGKVDYSAAWLLQTFLGYLGIHRMYMGKWVTGILTHRPKPTN